MSERTHEMNVFLREIKEKLKDEPKLYSLFENLFYQYPGADHPPL